MEHHLALRLEEMHFQSKRENFTKVWSFVIKVGIKFIGAWSEHSPGETL